MRLQWLSPFTFKYLLIIYVCRVGLFALLLAPTTTHPRLLCFQIALVNLYLSFIECEFILQPTPHLMPFAAWKAEADELFV